jgi:3-oxoadipate enol-lactonase
MLTLLTDDGCRLAYTLSGPVDGPPLVLSNSLGTDHGLWDRQIDVFAARFRVLRYDTRGHGASAAPAGPCTIDRLGRDVCALMDHVGFARAHVCGVSIGGLTALWLAVHAADRVDRLVLAHTAARIGSLALWDERMQIAASDGLGALADATMARWFTASFRAAAPDVVARTRATFLRVPVEGYLGCCAALRDADLRPEAAQVRARSLVVIGAHDVATPPADGEWLAGAIAGAGLLTLDAAHLGNLERAEEFNRAVGQFLSS